MHGGYGKISVCKSMFCEGFLSMSRKAYLKKWRKLSDKEADEELQQIKVEQDLFEKSVLPPTDISDFEGV